MHALAITDGNEIINNENYKDRMYSYLQKVSSAPSNYFVFIFSGTTYIQEERGNRPIRQTRVLLKQSIPVFFSYWRWRNNEPFAEFPDQSLFQSPIDKTLENIKEIVSYDFKNKKKIFIITFPHPSIVEFLELLDKNGWVTIYDVRDDWEEFQKVGQAKWFDSGIEEYIVNHSDIVSAVSSPLQQKIQSIAINKNVYLSPNALDNELLTDGKINISSRDGKPIIGYIGHLTSSWFDWQSLISIASLKPDWSFEIIGHHMPENLTLPSNIKYLGPKNQDEIKHIAKEWRAAIIPFKIGKLSDAVDPIKVYEYLCLGLPVVSFRMPQIHNYPYVFIANDVNEFIHQIERALMLPMDIKVIEDFLSKNRWEDRIGQLIGWSEEKLREKKTVKINTSSKDNSPLKILYLYRYGILGGVSTQLINRMHYLKNYCEPHFGFIKDYGVISAFGGYPHVCELASIQEIIDYINKYHFDAIIPIDTNEAYEAILKSNFKGTVVNEVHTTYEQNLRKLQLLQQNEPIDAIMTPSQYLQNRIMYEFKFDGVVPIYVVENCLDTELFENQAVRNFYDKRIILWVGKLDDHKNWRSFLSIAHSIREKIDDCEFWLVGGYTAADNVVESLRAEIKKHGLHHILRWIPRAAYHNMPKIYRAAANSGGCFISTSQNESFGMAIIEALACNCPCIVPNVGAIPEIMDGGLSNCLYTSNNEDEAISKILFFMENHRHRYEIMRLGRKKIIENYSIDTIGKKYIKILMNIIDEKVRSQS